MDPGTRATRLAVEFLTLWTEPGEEQRLNAASHIAEQIGDPEQANLAITGLLNLGMLLAIKLAAAEGTDPDEMLDRARAIVSDISVQLPE